MKIYIQKLAFLLVLGLVATSCDYDETNYDNLTKDYTGTSTYYLQFADAYELFETSFDPQGQPVDVTGTVAVKLIGPPQPQDVTVNLNLDPSSDITSDMYELGSSSLVIPAGETSASTSLVIDTDMLPVDETSSLVLSIDAGENEATTGTILTYDVFRTPPCIPIPGTYRIVMKDSYGDGWQTDDPNGGSGITIEVDGVQIAEIGLCSEYDPGDWCTGSGSLAETTVVIPDGSLFAKWTFPGDEYGEIGYEIYDPNGALVASANAGQATAGTIDVQACVEADAGDDSAD